MPRPRRARVYLVPKREVDGIAIRPTDGEDAHKYYIFIGMSDEGDRTAGVVINSKIHPQLKGKERDLQLPLLQSRYDFLKYNSFADCSTLMQVCTSRLGRTIGEIVPEDLGYIIASLYEAPNIRKAHLKAFGIERL